MNYVTEDGLNATFDLALHSLPPTSPVTVHIYPDPEASLREINFLQQIQVSPDTVVFDASNYTSTVQINITAEDDEWFEDLHWANIHINVTAAQESFRRMEHWLWVAVVDNERPEIIVEPLAVTVYETDGGLYKQPVIDLELNDGTAVYVLGRCPRGVLCCCVVGRVHACVSPLCLLPPTNRIDVEHLRGIPAGITFIFCRALGESMSTFLFTSTKSRLRRTPPSCAAQPTTGTPPRACL